MFKNKESVTNVNLLTHALHENSGGLAMLISKPFMIVEPIKNLVSFFGLQTYIKKKKKKIEN